MDWSFGCERAKAHCRIQWNRQVSISLTSVLVSFSDYPPIFTGKMMQTGQNRILSENRSWKFVLVATTFRLRSVSSICFHLHMPDGTVRLQRLVVWWMCRRARIPKGWESSTIWCRTWRYECYPECLARMLKYILVPRVFSHLAQLQDQANLASLLSPLDVADLL